jgi:hypothetical protein
MTDEWTGMPEEERFRCRVLPLYTNPYKKLKASNTPVKEYDMVYDPMPTKEAFLQIKQEMSWGEHRDAVCDKRRREMLNWKPDIQNMLNRIKALISQNVISSDEYEFIKHECTTRGLFRSYDS